MVVISYGFVSHLSHLLCAFWKYYDGLQMSRDNMQETAWQRLVAQIFKRMGESPFRSVLLQVFKHLLAKCFTRPSCKQPSAATLLDHPFWKVTDCYIHQTHHHIALKSLASSISIKGHNHALMLTTLRTESCLDLAKQMGAEAHIAHLK